MVHVKYFSGFSLHYLGESYKPATTLRAKKNLDKYNYNFGGDLLVTEPVAGYDSVLPSITNQHGTFWWRLEPGSDRTGLTLSEAFHANGLQETQKTGVMISAGDNAAFSHKVKNGLWRVAVRVANVGASSSFTLSAEGSRLGITMLGPQKHGTIFGYVAVKDGQLTTCLQRTRQRPEETMIIIS
ncbi:MAG: hypothetical protein KTR15_03860 [Phycisphaeraceae bacterium]|nr:hypothetical protein [Phycisphaeraceae bacterium]